MTEEFMTSSSNGFLTDTYEADGVSYNSGYPHIFAWMGPEPTALITPGQPGAQECMQKCPTDTMWGDVYGPQGVQLYAHPTHVITDDLNLGSNANNLCFYSSECPKDVGPSTDSEGNDLAGIFLEDTFGEETSGTCITKTACNDEGKVVYTTGREDFDEHEWPLVVTDDFVTVGGLYDEYVVTNLCVDTCKGHAEKLLDSDYDDPNDGLGSLEFWPYDNFMSLAGDGAGLYDLNYKAVTHEGTCLHTCPNWYDDSDDLIDDA